LARVSGGVQPASGVSASARVETGEVAFEAKAALRSTNEGRSAVLVRETASTDDIAGIAACQGLLYSSGGRTSHPAVVARHLQKVCVVGCKTLSNDLMQCRCRIRSREFAEGDVISLDAPGVESCTVIENDVVLDPRFGGASARIEAMGEFDRVLGTSSRNISPRNDRQPVNGP
jgi:pyruvate,orthophosphate dikinase